MIKLKTHKRGDTFAFICSFKDSQEAAMPGIASKLKCQIREQSRKLVYEVPIDEAYVDNAFKKEYITYDEKEMILATPQIASQIS